MSNNRKVQIDGNIIYQKDGGIDSYSFMLDRFYGDIDLNDLSPYLKINYSDDSGDKIALTKTSTALNINLLWNILTTHTAVSGEAECQITFENNDATTVFNSDVFSVDIKPSIAVDLCEVQAVPSAILQLQTELRTNLNYVEGVIDGGIVSSVNGNSGAVVVTPASIGASTPSELQSKINELLDGTKTVAKSQTSTSDASGNNIEGTYLKKANEKNNDWSIVYNKTLTSATANYVCNLQRQSKKVYAHIEIVGDTSSASEWGKITVYTLVNGVQKCIFSPTTAFLGKLANKKEVTFVVEMCGSFAQVKCIANYQSNGTKRDNYAVDGSVVGDYTAQTVGTDIEQYYMSSIQFVISGVGHSFGIGTKFSLTTVKYNEDI